jgi:hypothetical protein
MADDETRAGESADEARWSARRWSGVLLGGWLAIGLFCGALRLLLGSGFSAVLLIGLLIGLLWPVVVVFAALSERATDGRKR